MNEERLEYLLDRYFDEALGRAEQTELESRLLSSPQARELFWKRARFHALLRRRGRENWGRRLALQPPAEEPPRAGWRVRWAAWWQPVRWAGAAGLAILLLLWAVNRPDAGKMPATAGPAPLAAEPAPGETDTAPDQGVATILRAVDVKWTDGEEPSGNVLGPRWLKFESGLVEVEFHRGARVVIEGPAAFELISDRQARCLFGKLRADVPPPAVGFEILSPNVRVIDRSTAFGLLVPRDGPAEVHVFSGRVDFITTQSPHAMHELLQGGAVRVERDGAFHRIPNGAHQFITGAVAEQRANTAMAARYAAWREEAKRLRDDPSLLLQYTFENDSPTNRTLENKAGNASPASNGTIIGCSWTEGRWPGKPALDFKQVGDRVRLALPRQSEKLTCVAWVRIDAIDHPYIALLMSGEAAVGELTWQLRKWRRSYGVLVFAKRYAPGWGHGKANVATSTSAFGSNQCGSWMQLAFVFDAAAGTVTHYLDGQKLNVAGVPSNPLLVTGALEIGNWTPLSGDPVFPIRAFNGRMDEFLIFSRALTPEEIRRSWDLGRPL